MVCNVCHLEKPESDFYSYRRRTCKSCYLAGSCQRHHQARRTVERYRLIRLKSFNYVQMRLKFNFPLPTSEEIAMAVNASVADVERLFGGRELSV
jgi:hypothetical protein